MSPIGSGSSVTYHSGSKIVFERALVQQSVEIPAADYEKVRVFFEKIQQSEQSPVVLRRVAGPAPAEKGERPVSTAVAK